MQKYLRLCRNYLYLESTLINRRSLFRTVLGLQKVEQSTENSHILPCFPSQSSLLLMSCIGMAHLL